MEPTIQRFSRKCSSTGRDILPGESYYSALQETPAGIQRQDFCQEAWSGAPDDCFCWWKSRLPLPNQVRIRWACESVLLAYLQNCLAAQRWDVLNVLALALARRRILNITYPEQDSSDLEAETLPEITNNELILTIRSSGDTHRIPQVDFSQLDVAAIQAELDRHLFTDQIDEAESHD